MTDAKAVSAAVFRVFLDFIQSLNAEEVEQLINKKSKLALLPPGAVIASPGIEATGLNLLAGLIKKLPREQIADLLDKQGTLAYLPPGATIAYPDQTSGDIEAQLARLASRDAAMKYLIGLKLKAPELKKLARDLKVALDKSDKVGDIRNKIIEATVGTRVDATLIQGGRW